MNHIGEEFEDMPKYDCSYCMLSFDADDVEVDPFTKNGTCPECGEPMELSDD